MYGTTPEILKNITINEWKRAREYEMDHISQKCKKILIGEHSMGGVLTLIFARKYSFDGIFIISASLGIRRFVPKLVPFFKIFKKYYPIKGIKLEKETNG